MVDGMHLEKYDGHWENDNMHGYAICKYAFGTVYEGEWTEGLYSGTGVIFRQWLNLHRQLGETSNAWEAQ